MSANRHAVVCIVAAMFYLGGARAAAQLSPALAQAPAGALPEAAPPASGQRLMRYLGRALDTQGTPLHGTTGVTLAIYAQANGGAPLWQESQNVESDAEGNFSVLLGATTADGLPPELFASSSARWLAVLVHSPGAVEQPRVLLASVPYAQHAEDAAMLGGLPASAYLRRDPASSANPDATRSTSSSAGARPLLSASGATSGYLPVFSDSSGDLANSVLTQASGNIGIGIAAPTSLLHLLGSNPTLRVENYAGSNAGGSPNFNFYSARGTSSAPTATMSGDNLGQFAAAGYTGSGFSASTRVKVNFVATENWSPTANGTAMAFSTTLNGTSTRNERMRIDNQGNIGIGTTTPTHTLSFGGGQANTLGVEANPTSGAAGSSLQLSSGAAASGSNNQPGGDLLLTAGSGSGSGAGGALRLQSSGDAASATAPGTVTDRLLIAGKPKAIVGGVANLFSLHVAAGEAAGGRVKFTVVASDGTHYAAETGELIYLALPQRLTCQLVVFQYSSSSTAYTNTVLSVPPLGQPGALNAGCMESYFSGDPGIQFTDTPPASFTATTHKVYYTIENQSQAVITLQP